MNKENISVLETCFNQLIESLLEKKATSEEFILKLSSEFSQFTRFNHARIRQTGIVLDTWIKFTLIRDGRTAFRKFPLVGNWEIDWRETHNALVELRKELPLLALDPHLVLPSATNPTREIYSGNLLAEDAVASTVLEPAKELDFTGIYSGGIVIRAYADSSGNKHWFASDTFTLDYSIFSPQEQAVKGFLAGNNWDEERYLTKITNAKQQLELLSHPPKNIPRGNYKTYFAPAAVSELLSMLSWSGVSEADIQQGNSALATLSRKEKQLSPKFNLKENFQRGSVPRFNEWGEVTTSDIKIIEKGVLVNSLVNCRSAKEYQKKSNGANRNESLRTPEIEVGNLESEEILNALDTGLYVSNLHYLNWSDLPTGRITGMTRYACFWVEDGEIVAPIEDLRFDETLYRFWGNNLIEFTNFQEFIPNLGTYENRQLGGSMVPGMLVKDFTYTL
ncbi:TldD/PmbA family protein [Mastigocoleus testarum]|uniref:Zn-dependent protease n=1 Tax=Mastigocoleus testarum BC008 TaxID=371196 RepID=A0A0V7ZPN4_9CYAN|nr:TldD/PmbA family protein [Mastigocoleus testarum]KST66411.1 Zn-dependent protease [Mastigocoleus testarum BC008]